MADFEDVVQVRFVAAGARASEAHVTETSSDFHQVLAGNLRIGLPGHPVVRQEAVHRFGVNDLSSNQVDGGLTQNTNVPGRIKGAHGTFSPYYHSGIPFPRYFYAREQETSDQPLRFGRQRRKWIVLNRIGTGRSSGVAAGIHFAL